MYIIKNVIFLGDVVFFARLCVIILCFNLQTVIYSMSH